MPLEPPVLDNRNFEDLLAEARLRIARYNPEWTDYNDSDPGVTLVQLFAWLTELMLYQINQVPDRNYIKFLQLIGQELRPAQPSSAHLTFVPVDGALVDPVRPFTKLTAQPTGGGSPLIFETEEGLDLVRVRLTDLQAFDGSTFSVVTAANQPGGTQFLPFGVTPTVGSALYLGFAPGNPPARPRLFPSESRLRVFMGEGFLAGSALSAERVKTPSVPPVQLVWEYRPQGAGKRWQSLNVFVDESFGFTREGYIKFEGPSNIALSVEGRVTEPRYWLRIRVASGEYAKGRAPKLDFLRFNTVPAVNLSTLKNEQLGVSTGTPSQIFRLSQRPVQKRSIELSIEVAGQSAEMWTQVDDLLTAGPDDPKYVVNAARSEILFGNATHGRIPPAGCTITARRYRFGGGTNGNVAAGDIGGKPAFVNGIESVSNERPAIGGREEQTVAELKSQAPQELRSRGRAVTADDFNYLAGQAGGVAKATAIALMHPEFPGVEVPGAITAVIVPDSDDLAPVPSADQLQSVARYLNEYRLITTELFVTGPKYVEIKVETVIAAQPYASFDAVTQDIIAALQYYLDPLARLPKFGKLSEATVRAAGIEGWAFGESLHPNNLFSVILGVDGVAWVKTLRVYVQGRPHELSEAVDVPPNGLFSSGSHEVTVGPT